MQIKYNRLSFSQYLTRRGFCNLSITNLFHQMIIVSLIQPGFLKFWRMWNPFCGYILFLFYVHIGGNRKRNIALVIVFLSSGFILHDLLIFLITGIFSFVFTIGFSFYSAMITINSFYSYEKYIYRNSKLENAILNICFIISGLFIGYTTNYLFFPNSVLYNYLSH